MSDRLVVEGTADAGFESLVDVFERSDLGRGGAAFAAYVDGHKVVDLWAGVSRPGEPWREETLTIAMSATKGMAALCAQILADRGLLDVEAPVSQYWPEYAQAGKEPTLVRHVLNHTSGMLCFRDPGALLDWDGNGWGDYDEIARRMAESPPSWEPGTRIGYHGISIGWVLQELVRRITGQTIGSFFGREVAGPLGLSVFIGADESVQRRLADVVTDPPVQQDNPMATAIVELYKREMNDPDSLMAQAGLFMHGSTLGEHFDRFFNLPAVRSIEIPAANGSADARSLARAYAVLAQGGELDGVRLVSTDSTRRFGTKTYGGPTAIWPESGLPEGFPRPEMRYALGYEGDFGEAPEPWRFGPTPTSFGHLGAGGQIGFADPDRRVAVGFLRSHLGPDWAVSNALVDELYRRLPA